MKKLTIILGLLLITSCTDNSSSRNWGGNSTIIVNNPNEKLMNVAWKGNELWIISVDTISNELHMREKSSFGLIEGSITIKNQK